MTRTLTLRRLLAVAALTALVPLGAACSSGSAPPNAPGAASSASSPSSGSGASPPFATPGQTAASPATGGSTAAAADYCAVLKAGQQELRGLSGSLSDAAALEKGLAVVRRIEAAAPPEVKQAWGDFLAFVEAATSRNTSALTDAMSRMAAAGAEIAAHAKTSCKLNLS